MKKNQKMMMSAAALAVLASSASAACGAQSQSVSQAGADPVGDADTVTTASAESATGDAVATTASGSSGSSDSSSVGYVDGTYTGSAASTRWGDVQVSVVVSDGSIVDVQFLDYPDDDSRSAQINAQATVTLVQEAIQSQSSSVQAISGATFTSEAFMQSLDSALAQAV